MQTQIQCTQQQYCHWVQHTQVQPTQAAFFAGGSEAEICSSVTQYAGCLDLTQRGEGDLEHSGLMLHSPPLPSNLHQCFLSMYVLLTYKNGKMCEMSLIYIFLPISATKRTMNTKSTQSTKWYCSQKDKSIEVSHLQMDMVHQETMLKKGGKLHKWTMFTKGQSP